MNKDIQFFSALLGAIIGFLFGKIDGLLIALLVVIVLDYITGLVHAKINKSLSSAVGFKGLAKKRFHSRNRHSREYRRHSNSRFWLYLP